MLETYKKMNETLYGTAKVQHQRLTLQEIVEREGLIQTSAAHKMNKLKRGILKQIDLKRKDVQTNHWYNFLMQLDIQKGIELKLIDNVGQKEWDLITIQLKNFK